MAGTHGYGTTLKLGTTTVSELTSISGPALSADTIDVSSLTSADKYREFIQGMRDGGEISIEGNFDYSDNVSTIYDQFNTTSAVTATITMETLPSNTQWAALVICSGVEFENPMDDKIGVSATLKVSGKPVLSQI